MTSVALLSQPPLQATVVLGTDGTIVGWSASAQTLLGYLPTDALGTNATRMFGAPLMAAIARARAENEVREHHTARRLDGQDLLVELHVSHVLLGTDDASERFVVTARDASALREYDSAASHQNELEQYLIGVVGHDLRNPLNAVTLTATHLLNHTNDPKVRRSLERINASAERGVRMTYDLLDFNRVRREHGLPIVRRLFDLAELVHAVVKDALHFRSERSVPIQVIGDTRGEWDYDRLYQVVQNLVGNALQHTTEEVGVEVKLSGHDTFVELEVHNGGPPISPTIQENLFQPYLSGRSMTTSGRSVGLGLFIARAIAASHGGTLAVLSSVEAGTSFTVRLPRSGRQSP